MATKPKKRAAQKAKKKLKGEVVLDGKIPKVRGVKGKVIFDKEPYCKNCPI